MIVIKIKGGLGNQMFQYAIAKAFSLETKRKFKLDISIFEWYKLHNYGLHHFNIRPEFYTPESKWKMKLKKLFNKVVFYNEDFHAFHHNPDLIHTKSDFLFLEGYFQSQKYFIKYEKEIRNDFQIITPLKKQTSDMVAYMQSVNAVEVIMLAIQFMKRTKQHTTKKLCKLLKVKLKILFIFYFLTIFLG